jgi:hypothetical protein
MNQRADSLKKNLGKMWTPPRKNHQGWLLSHTDTTFAGILPPEDWKTFSTLAPIGAGSFDNPARHSLRLSDEVIVRRRNCSMPRERRVPSAQSFRERKDFPSRTNESALRAQRHPDGKR